MWNLKSENGVKALQFTRKLFTSILIDVNAINGISFLQNQIIINLKSKQDKLWPPTFEASFGSFPCHLYL